MKLPSKREMEEAERKRLGHKRAIPKVARRDPETGELKLVPRRRPPDRDKVFRRLEGNIPREQWAEIMQAAPDDKAQRLYKILMDPRYKRRTLPWMAREAGLTYPEVVLLFKNHKMGEGTIRMSQHLPQAMEDVAVDALSKDVTCGHCKGEKVVPVMKEEVDDKTGKRTLVQETIEVTDPKTGSTSIALHFEHCFTCDGKGTVRIIGDADSRKLLFEATGLTGKHGPLIVQQNNFGGAQSMEDSVGQAQDAIDVPVLKELNP